jgi:hypothetical protein
MFNPAGAHNLYKGLDLSGIYQHSRWQYSALASFMILLSALKAWLFYCIIRIFMQLNMVKPFSGEIANLVSRISYYTFSIGLIGAVAKHYTGYLSHRGFDTGSAASYWNDHVAFLMMAGVVFVIAQVFKRGIEIQAENDLTV